MDVDDRLTKLEKESRNWRRIACGLAVTIGIMLSCSRSPEPTINSASGDSLQPGSTHEKIRTRSLEIVDSEGKNVASLFVGSQGGANLMLSSADNSDHIWISTGYGFGNSIRLSNKNGSTYLTPSSVSINTISAAQQRARERAFDQIQSGATGEELRQAMEAYSTPPAVSIGVTDTLGGIVEIHNPHGKCVASIQCNKTNQGAVYVMDVGGNLKAALAAD